MKNKNIILTILGVIVLILVTVGITTLLYNKNSEKTLSELPRKKYDILITEGTPAKTLKYEFNNNKVEIVVNEGTYSDKNIKINDRLLELSVYSISSIEFVGEYIIFNAGQFAGDYIYIFDINGDLIYEIFQFEENQRFINYKIENNKIIIETEKFNNYCEEMSKYGNEIVKKYYEVKYDDRNGFSRPKLINSKTLDEIKDEYCKNDFIGVENEITNNNYDYYVKLNNKKINIYNMIDFKYDVAVEYANINISGFKLNGIDSTIKIENVASTSMCAIDEKSKIILLNNNIIETYAYEGCYLVTILEIFTIEDKFVGIITQGDSEGELSGRILNIYNSDGEKMYRKNIVSFDSDNYEFITYVDYNNLSIKKYKLTVSDNNISAVEIK